MSKNLVLIIVIIGIIIAAVIIVLGIRGGLGGLLPASTDGDVAAGNDGLPVETDTYKLDVPDVELTEPVIEAPAAPGVEASFRKFNMTISRSGYDPSQIVVNQGDTVSISLTASGGEYDITLPDLGLYQSVAEGQKKTLEFQTGTVGTFTYECRDMCPGSTIQGQIIVKPR